MVLDKTHAGITGSDNRSVGKLCCQAGTVAEASIVTVVQDDTTVFVDFPQALSVGADPQVSFPVSVEAPDPDTLQLCGQTIFNKELHGAVYDVQSVVRSDIIIPVPLGYSVDNLVLHAEGGVDILER